MIKRLIFDVDGTLITGVDFNSSIESTLKKFEHYSEKNMKKFMEAISSYEKIFNNYNKTDYLNHFSKYLGVELDYEFLKVFFNELKSCVPLECLELKASIVELSKEYELVLLTNYFKESQLNRLYTMGINDLFSECYGEELIKPNDEIYIKACGNHNPNECVMIGDDPYLDVEKAQNLGINTIFVNTKNLKVDTLNTLVVNSVEEITINLIESITNLKKS